jgi:phospholipid/cholesterol/gamma-HCH transport system substrate-binding protein
MKSRRRRGAPALLIAVVMILIPVFVTYYAFHKRLPFTSQYTDYVVVPNSVNLRSGSPVRIAGIDVGTVEGVSPDGRATKVAFALDSNGLPIHRDATATIRERLFLEGSYYLDLFPGSPSAPSAPEGFTIPEASTATPVQFFQLLSTFDVAARSNLAATLNTADIAFSPAPGQPPSDSGSAGLQRAIPQLTPLMKDVSIDSQALQGTHPGDVENLLASTADVFGTLATNSRQLTGLVAGLQRASAALASGDGALARSVVGLDRALQVAPGALSAVGRALPPVTRLATALTPSLQRSPALVTALANSVSEVNAVVAPSVRGPLLSSLRTTLATFPSVLTQVANLFSTARPVTQCLITHVLPVLQERVPDGALSTNEPVWKDFIHFLPSLASASGQFDGNGPYIRNLVGAGDNSVQSGAGLGSVPGLGQLVGTSPGGSTIEGARPQWVGTLTSSAFRPDVPCASDPVPDLSATPAAPDLRPDHSSAEALHPTLPQLERDLLRAAGGRRAAVTATRGVRP